MSALWHLVFALALLSASAAVTVSAGQNLRQREHVVAAVDICSIAILLAFAIRSLKEFLP